MDSRPLEGRRAIVTGASRGIGAAVAERLAAEGASVAVTARTLDAHPTLPGSLTATAARIAASGGSAVTIAADLTDEADRARIVPAAVEGLDGSIDILVNNAAAAIYQPMLDYPLRRRRLTFEVNVHAPLDLMQAVTPAMVDNGEGWIVNISSASAKLAPGPPFRTAGVATTIGIYGASKAALDRETNAMAVDLWGKGIRVNCVEPRAAVMSEGAEVLIGGQLSPNQIESMEQMVEATVALCRCGPDLTGRVCVSLDLIDELGLEVRNLDGTPCST